MSGGCNVVCYSCGNNPIVGELPMQIIVIDKNTIIFKGSQYLCVKCIDEVNKRQKKLLDKTLGGTKE